MIVSPLNSNYSSIDDSHGEYKEDIKIVTGIEGGNVFNVTRLSENHFSLQMKPDVPSVYTYPDHHCYWFYFRIEGVRGKKIKIDIANCEWMPRHWKKYKPVYSYAEDPDSLSGVEWYRIEQTSLKGINFSFIQEFEKDHAWVALRYPYNYTRLIRYKESIKDNEYVYIEELGSTALSNTLFMITITDKGVQANKKKGVLVIAREHGIEQDGSWVAEGMTDYILSSEPEADMLRRNFIFMIAPIILPDAAMKGMVVDPTTGSSPGKYMDKRADSHESMMLGSRMARFVQEGNTLDIAISLHNPHGTEPNIYPHYRPCKNSDLLKKAKRLHKSLIRHAAGFTTWREFACKSCAFSVGSFARDFGSIAAIYEVNHQAYNNYLSIEGLKGMGGAFLKGMGDYYGLLR